MRRYSLWFGLAVVAGLLVAAAVASLVAAARPYTNHGSVIQQDFKAPDLSLPDGKGESFQLAQQRGKVVVMFFGFTHCPDICPTTMADFARIHQRLGKDAGRVDFVFISVDPDRDTPQITAQYAAKFDPSFVGLSGTEQQLTPVWKAYGVYRQLDKKSPTDTNYNVEHSTQIYLVDPSGNLRITYSYGTPVDDMLQDIRHLLG